MTFPDDRLAPRRGRRGPAATTATPGRPRDMDEPAADEVAIGTETALLGALSRMQLKLDLIARSHAASVGALEVKIDALTKQLDDLTTLGEAATTSHVDPPQTAAENSATTEEPSET